MENNFHRIFHQSDFEDMYCTIEEVQHSLQSLDVSKASGPDKVSARMLKETASSIAPSITNLFNCSIRFGKLPIQWKTSMIVPIPKSTNFANPENYRPISLICILCKLLERHMYIMMEEESSIHLSTTQWGFRSRLYLYIYIYIYMYGAITKLLRTR